MQVDDSDPRVGRTRQHVLTTVREILAEQSGMPTFTQVSERANVARQTLYKHWGTVELLVAASIVVGRIGRARDYDGLELRDRAELFFDRLVQEVDPTHAHALSILIVSVRYNRDSREAYDTLDANLFEMFCRMVIPLDHDQFVQLVTPVMFLAMTGMTAGPALLGSLIERTLQFAAARLSEPPEVG